MKTRLGDRERKAKKGLSKANTAEAFNNLWRAVNISLATVVLSDKVLDALASAITAPDAFYELGRSTTIVTFNLHQKSQTQVTAINLVYFLKGNVKSGVSVECIFRQISKHFSNMLKETTPRRGFWGRGGAKTLNSGSKDLPLLGQALPFNHRT